MLYRLRPGASEAEKHLLSAWTYLQNKYVIGSRDINDAIDILIDAYIKVRGI
jgi:hypothetical protein